ncbi:adenosylcobinamide-GDP ribazoletransferase [Nitrincola alkalilacustris]|uniref:adenosylcobinamide-GDP ribazoletransferase n=1 Tax=Nitrincola alkalilacustris TaxID=1571224 RepID=UPI00124CF6AC|nr:adenosylcobinamide-GDP ribazoletransferase [Nitrincola alkalilacustris]
MKVSLQHEWQAFWLALGFLTRIPMLVRIDYSQSLMNQSSVYFPLVGLLLGAGYVGLYLLLSQLWSLPVCLLLVLIFHLWITGAFHEDGLADSIDALGGGYTVEKRLSIMKDSRIGTYGSVALIMALGLKLALWLSIDGLLIALLIVPAIARFTPLLLMHFMRYVTDPDSSRSKPVAESFSGRRLLLAGLFCLLLSLLTQTLFWSLLAVAATALIWGFYLQRQLGGYTGDTLGASVILTELVLLLLLAV